MYLLSTDQSSARLSRANDARSPVRPHLVAGQSTDSTRFPYRAVKKYLERRQTEVSDSSHGFQPEAVWSLGQVPRRTAR